MRGKSLLSSKLFWTGFLTIAISFLGWLSGVIPGEYQPIVAAFSGVFTIAFRLFSNEPIKSIV